MGKEENKQLDRMMVKISHLDTLLNLVGEVIITASNLQSSNRLAKEFYDKQRPMDKMLLDMLQTTEVSSTRISTELHELVMDVRMVEIRQTFQRFRRSIRDMAKETGKQVELVTEGDATLIDKTIAEKLYDPLTHQIRNAIDHGIELPLERQKVGKPPLATVTLRAYEKDKKFILEIRDDGRGINPDTIATAAVAKGVVAASHVATMSDKEKLDLIYAPGLSTRSEASSLSGRGVGMDVVKSNITGLAGQIDLETSMGNGSLFTYTIPQLTAVNIVDCLTVRVGTNYFAIPIIDVGTTLGIRSSDVSSAFQKSKTIMVQGSLVILFDMNELLGDPPLPDEDELTIVIIEAKNGRIALRVSELLSPEKLVFAPLATVFDVQGVSGTTMPSGNRMGLIIDTEALINLSQGVKTVDAAEVQAPLFTSLDSAPPLGGDAAALPTTSQQVAVAPSDGIGALLDMGHREEFIMELEAMIKDADEQILLLEQNPDDSEIINRIFRDFHSMKGNLMMVGLSPIGDFIHQVEFILDQVRQETLTITSDIIDILLDVSDTIKNVSIAITAHKTPSLNAALRDRVAQYQVKEEKKEETVDISQRTFDLTGIEQFNLMAQQQQGAIIVELYLKVAPKKQLPVLVILLILKRICDIGALFGTVPPFNEIIHSKVNEEIKVRFSSIKSRDEIQRYVDDVLKKYYDVVECELMVID